ncbi:MAG: tetratricopeptide repeat protein, partial [Lachnospiraceae bacterium]|nr:tetratricopeptide repeat protein [Lachnospiraceae bacterium]
MANKNTKETEQTVMNAAEPNFSEKMGKHKNAIIGVGIGGVVVILGGLGWWMWNKQSNQKSSEAYTTALTKSMKSNATDSVMIKDLEKVAQSESGKTGGTLANIQLAGMYLQNNQYQKALDAINNTDIDEPVMEMNANLLKGDAYVGLKKYAEAISAYDEVYNKAQKNNPEVAVRALMKKASVLDAQKKNTEA